jgi:hypothetical protein
MKGMSSRRIAKDIEIIDLRCTDYTHLNHAKVAD